MATAISGDLVQVVQGFQRLDLDVQDLKGRLSRLEGQVDRLEARIERLEGRMDKLEASNEQILGYVKRIATMLIALPGAGESQESLNARVDALERRVLALEQ